MSNHLKNFTQEEYSRILDKCKGHQLSNAECMKILMDHGASYNQAKNGAYTYLHHGDHLIAKQKGSQNQYNQLLDEFDGTQKSNIDCIRYLESLGFSQGQSKNAVYKYRCKRGLISRKR